MLLFQCWVLFPGSKAVTFATEAVSITEKEEEEARYVEETPLMFSRCSSPDSLPECTHDDQGSVLSEVRYAFSTSNNIVTVKLALVGISLLALKLTLL